MSVASSRPEDSLGGVPAELTLDPVVDGLCAPVVVACSGGADSLGLLVARDGMAAAAQFWQQQAETVLRLCE